MNWDKAALGGLLGGAWWGLLFGILFAIFVPSVVWVNVVLSAIATAAVFGLIFGLIGYAFSGGRRNFHSATGMKASSYTVGVPAQRAEEALSLLAAGR